MPQEFSQIDRRHPRNDALPKALGLERFAADHYPEGLLWAGARRAGIPHARIRTVDVSAAAALPGVVRVLTRADVAGSNLQGIVHKDQPVLAGDKVRHCGDAVALVLAVDRETLARALSLVRLDLEPLPGVFDPAQALKKGAPLVHEGRRGGNVLVRASIRTGRGAAVLRECPVVVRGTFSTPMQAHAFIETENGTARLLPDGTLEMTVSTQAPFRDRFEIAQALGLDPMRIRVVAPYLGGGFGGKDGATVQCLLALAALHAGGRPVKMWWEREESMLAGYKRHAARLTYALGADRDGTLRALSCRIVMDSGAYAHLGGEVMALGMESAGGPYRIPHADIRGLCVYTNNPVAGAFRGFGAAQTAFAAERMMDRLAEKLGMDPLELRLRNALRRGDRNAAGVTMTASTGMAACLEALRAHPAYAAREAWKRAAPPHARRGAGVAAACIGVGYGRGLPDAATARIELTETGTFRIFNAVPDMGQGNASAFALIAAEALGQSPASFELVQPDTACCLPSGSSSAGRTTYTYGNALVRACGALRDRLLVRGAMALLADDTADLTLAPGAVRHVKSGRAVPLALLARMMILEDRTATAEFVMPVTPDATGGKGFVIGFPHLLFAYAAVLALSEVDELTGAVRVRRFVSATDGGRVLNPQGFEQQVAGALIQGMGWALSEDVLTREGRILNPDLSTYLVPTAADAPEVDCLAVDSVEETGPFGMKGIGEVNLNAALPSIGAAVQDACGARLDAAPLTPEKVLGARPRRARRTP